MSLRHTIDAGCVVQFDPGEAEVSSCSCLVDTGFGYLTFKSTTDTLYISESKASATW